MSNILPFVYQSSNGISSKEVCDNGTIVKLNSFSMPYTKSDTLISGIKPVISKSPVSVCGDPP